MKPFFVYILRCSDGSYYTGHTDDLEKRMVEHEHGAIPGHTSVRRPVQLVWSDEMETRDDAIQREMQIKRWSRAKKDALIRGDWIELVSRSGPRTGVDLRRHASLRGVRPSTGSGRTDSDA